MHRIQCTLHKSHWIAQTVNACSDPAHRTHLVLHNDKYSLSSLPGRKAHLQQPVGLVQNQHIQTPDWAAKVQTIFFPPEHILQAAGSRDHNVRSETRGSSCWFVSLCLHIIVNLITRHSGWSTGSNFWFLILEPPCRHLWINEKDYLGKRLPEFLMTRTMDILVPLWGRWWRDNCK